VRCPPNVFDEAEDVAESVRARGAGERCALEYAEGDAVADALRRDALDALGRRESALAVRGSPLPPDVRARTEPPAVDADVSEETDALADGSAASDVGGAHQRARLLDVDEVSKSPRRAADALLSARGRVIAPCSDALLPPCAQPCSP
jgi:hypothetical protein